MNNYGFVPDNLSVNFRSPDYEKPATKWVTPEASSPNLLMAIVKYLRVDFILLVSFFSLSTEYFSMHYLSWNFTNTVILLNILVSLFASAYQDVSFTYYRSHHLDSHDSNLGG